MLKREIKKQLRRLPEESGLGTRTYEKRKEQAVAELLGEEAPEFTGGGMGAFFFSQFRFIRKRIWLIQAAFIVFLLAAAGGDTGKNAEQSYVLLAVAAPVLLLLSVEEVSRIYHGSMLEIEYTTRYSLQKAVILRLLLLGTADLFFMLAFMLLFQRHMELSALRLVLYGFTPFFTMCFGCLLFMRKYSGGSLQIASLVWAAVHVLLAQAGSWAVFSIYEEGKLYLWMLLLLAVTAASAAELHKLSRRLTAFEQITVI